MKFSKLKIILIFVIMILIPIINYAVNIPEVVLSSNKTLVKSGEEVEVYYSIEGEETAAYLLNIYYNDEKFEFVSGPEKISVQNGNIKILWYDSQGGSGAKEGELGSIILRAKEDGITNISTDGEFYDKDSNLIETSFNDVQIEIGNQNLTEPQIIQEKNTNLETLAIENEILYPAFDNNITEYNVEVSSDIRALNILAIPENEQANVIIKGNEDLTQGDNNIIVSVTSSDGTVSKDYYITAHKRNSEEEAEFENHQDELEDELEHAYEIEKISALYEDSLGDSIDDSIILDNENSEEFEKYGFIKLYLLIILIMLIICAVFTLIESKIYKK